MFWKIYFWVQIIVMGSYHLSVGLGRIWEVLAMAINVVSFIGLFGFCWEKKVLGRLFWRLFLPGMVVWHVFYLGFAPEPEGLPAMVGGPSYELACEIFAGALLILWFVALFLYGFRRNYLWE